jgi:hypothetical protein
VWAEHLRQHERQNQADREVEQRLSSYVAADPKVRHLIYANSIKTIVRNRLRHPALPHLRSAGVIKVLRLVSRIAPGLIVKAASGPPDAVLAQTRL